MGLTYGQFTHNGQPVANATINFWKDGLIEGSDVTDGSGYYALTLLGPCAYRAMSGGVTLSPYPVNVPSGMLLQDLTNPSSADEIEGGETISEEEAAQRLEAADHKLFIFQLKLGQSCNGTPLQGPLPAEWGIEYQIGAGKHHCKGRKHQPEAPEKDVEGAVVVLEGPPTATASEAAAFLKPELFEQVL